MIDKEHGVSVARQCELLSVNRSSVYYQPVAVPAEDLAVMRALDEIHLLRPFLGSRRLVDELAKKGFVVNRKRVLRLMRVVGVSPIYPKPRTTRRGRGVGHRIYPFLLDGLVIERPNQVWAADITYIPMARGFCYLVGIIDVYSRRLLAGGLVTAWTRASASTPLRRRWSVMGNRRSSTATRAVNSPRTP